jgi:hypothetical protein
MLRRLISFLTTVLVAGALGFASGVYFAPTDEAARFRGIIDDNIDLINKIAHAPAEKPKDEPTGDAAATPPASEPEKAGGSEGDAASRDMPAVSADPGVSGAGAAPAAEANDAFVPAAVGEPAPAAAPSAPPAAQPAAAEPPPAPKAKPAVKKPAPKPAPKPKPKPQAAPPQEQPGN